jgi:hypothetical protein
MSAAAVELEAGLKLGSFAFHRVEVRHTRLKRRCDCGCWVDGSEPYHYQVWKLVGAAGIEQRLDCEFCARVDGRY